MPEMRFHSKSFLLFLSCAVSSLSLLGQTAKHPFSPDDIYRLQQVRDPQVSPDGQWIAYTVTTMDRAADKRRSSIWMVNWEGTQDVQLTFGPASDSSPQWSPDGKYLAFLSSPEGGNSDEEKSAEGKSQVWVLDRRGGAPHPLTNVKAELDTFRWSPDGKRLLLTMQESEDAETAHGSKPKAPKPIVIDRQHFKEDIEGYLTAASPEHLYLFDIASKKLDALTGRNAEEKTYNDSAAEWSPDGSHIAFVSNHAKEPDRTGTDDIFIVEARPDATPRQLLTTYAPNQQRLAWSPDGQTLAFTQGLEPKLYAYIQDQLAVASVTGGKARVLTAKLDRAVSHAHFTTDGSALTFVVEDDQRQYAARVAVAGGEVQRMGHSDVLLSEFMSNGARMAALGATDASAQEIYALENGEPHKLTAHTDALASELQLGAVEDMSFRSKDGTEIHGLMIKPPSYQPGKKYPTLLWIHGGPNGQDEHELNFGLYPLQLERQYFAGHGYVVLAINYRGSSGRGAAFAQSIWGDWGNKEVADLLAAVDYAIQKGIADPNRLGIGGWSYGGILTDYTIASDPRFKAAISGAGSANQISMFGSDQYILQYNNELGPPWKNPDLWLKVSYPFFHADRIHTPTLFMGGEKDFNVPITGSEQMYESLRTLGIPTQLVIYPGQFHIFTRPSYIHDRLGRHLAWFDKYLSAQN